MIKINYIIRRGNDIYRIVGNPRKDGNGWWLLWMINPNKGFIGEFESNDALFEWINEAEKMKQHPSFRTRAPRRPLKDIPVGDTAIKTTIIMGLRGSLKNRRGYVNV